MEDRERMGQEPPVGAALQRALEARGLMLSPRRARKLALALLSLIEQDLLVAAKPRISPSEDSP
jgi:hypothetical protein